MARTRGMPRFRAAPEHNILQNPAVTRGVQLFTGTRQAHVMSAMAEGLQPVVVTGDIREDPRTGLPLSFAAFKDFTTDGANAAFWPFINPSDSTRIVVLRRFHAYSEEGSIGPLNTYLYYSQHNVTIGTSASVSAGRRTTFDWNGTGVAPVVPYDPVAPSKTAAGWSATRINGINAAYFWRAPWFGTSLTATGWQISEILEDFNGLHGPRVVLFPGSAVDIGIADMNASAYFNMWWDEYPLT